MRFRYALYCSRYSGWLNTHQLLSASVWYGVKRFWIDAVLKSQNRVTLKLQRPVTERHGPDVSYAVANDNSDSDLVNTSRVQVGL